MEDKLELLYNSYIENGLLSSQTTLEQFSQADSSIQEKLYQSGLDANIISNQTDFSVFSSAFGKKKDDSGADSETQSEVSSADVQEPETIFTPPTEPTDRFFNIQQDQEFLENRQETERIIAEKKEDALNKMKEYLTSDERGVELSELDYRARKLQNEQVGQNTGLEPTTNPSTLSTLDFLNDLGGRKEQKVRLAEDFQEQFGLSRKAALDLFDEAYDYAHVTKTNELGNRLASESNPENKDAAVTSIANSEARNVLKNSILFSDKDVELLDVTLRLNSAIEKGEDKSIINQLKQTRADLLEGRDTDDFYKFESGDFEDPEKYKLYQAVIQEEENLKQQYDKSGTPKDFMKRAYNEAALNFYSLKQQGKRYQQELSEARRLDTQVIGGGDKAKDVEKKIKALNEKTYVAESKMLAAARLYGLNEDPETLKENFRYHTDAGLKAFTSGMKGVQSPTVMDSRNFVTSILDEAGIKYDSDVEQALKQTLGEQASQQAGGLSSMLVQFALIDKTLNVAKVPNLIRGLQATKNPIVKSMGYGLRYYVEGEKFQAVGGDFLGGAGFAASQDGLNKLADLVIKNPRAKAIFKAFNLGPSFVVASEVSEVIHAAEKGLFEEGSFKRFEEDIKESYGDIDEVSTRVLLSMGMGYGLGGKKIIKDMRYGMYWRSPEKLRHTAEDLRSKNKNEKGEVREDVEAAAKELEWHATEIENYRKTKETKQEEFEDIVTKNDKSESTLEGQNVKPTAEKIEAERSDLDIMESKIKEEVAKKETKTPEVKPEVKEVAETIELGGRLIDKSAYQDIAVRREAELNKLKEDGKADYSNVTRVNKKYDAEIDALPTVKQKSKTETTETAPETVVETAPKRYDLSYGGKEYKVEFKEGSEKFDIFTPEGTKLTSTEARPIKTAISRQGKAKETTQQFEAAKADFFKEAKTKEDITREKIEADRQEQIRKTQERVETKTEVEPRRELEDIINPGKKEKTTSEIDKIIDTYKKGTETGEPVYVRDVFNRLNEKFDIVGTGKAKQAQDALRRELNPYSREKLEKDVKEKFKATEKESDAIMKIVDGQAGWWKKQTGRNESEFFELVQDVTTAKGRQGRASVTLQENGKRLIKAFEKADVSSISHELHHLIEPYIPSSTKKVIAEWAGQKGYKEGDAWTPQTREMSANAWERYLASRGETLPENAPKDLRQAFDVIKEAFTNIYGNVRESLQKVGVVEPGKKTTEVEAAELTPEIIEIFDQMAGIDNVPGRRKLSTNKLSFKEKAERSVMEAGAKKTPIGVTTSDGRYIGEITKVTTPRARGKSDKTVFTIEGADGQTISKTTRKEAADALVKMDNANTSRIESSVEAPAKQYKFKYNPNSAKSDKLKSVNEAITALETKKLDFKKVEEAIKDIDGADYKQKPLFAKFIEANVKRNAAEKQKLQDAEKIEAEIQFGMEAKEANKQFEKDLEKFDGTIESAPEGTKVVESFQPEASFTQPERAKTPVKTKYNKDVVERVQNTMEYLDIKTPERKTQLKREAIKSMVERLKEIGTKATDAELKKIATDIYKFTKSNVEKLYEVKTGVSEQVLKAITRGAAKNEPWVGRTEALKKDSDKLIRSTAEMLAFKMTDAQYKKFLKGEEIKKTKGNVSSVGTARDRITLKETIEFIEAEIMADRAVFGAMSGVEGIFDARGVGKKIYASITDGQYLSHEASGIIFKWNKATPMAVVPHHHVGATGNFMDMHMSVQGKIKDIAYGDRKMSYDVHNGVAYQNNYRVTNGKGASVQRTHMHMIGMKNMFETGRSKTVWKKAYENGGVEGVTKMMEQMMVESMVGGGTQGTASAFFGKKAGYNSVVARNGNRTEAMITDPHPSYIKSVEIKVGGKNAEAEVARLEKFVHEYFEASGLRTPKITYVTKSSERTISPRRAEIEALSERQYEIFQPESKRKETVENIEKQIPGAYEYIKTLISQKNMMGSYETIARARRVIPEKLLTDTQLEFLHRSGMVELGMAKNYKEATQKDIGQEVVDFTQQAEVVITRKQTKVMEDKLRAYRDGLRRGGINTRKLTRDYKREIEKFIKEDLGIPQSILTRSEVKRMTKKMFEVTSPEQAHRALTEIVAIAEKAKNRELLTQLETLGKKGLKVTKQGSIRKGKATAEAQATFDKMNEMMRSEMTKEQAQDRMSELVDKIETLEPGTKEYKDVANEIEMLGFVGYKSQSNQQLQDLQAKMKRVVEDGRTERQHKDAERSAEKEARVEEFLKILTKGDGVAVTTEGKLDASRIGRTIEQISNLENWMLGWDALIDKVSKFDKSSGMYESALSKFTENVHISEFKENAKQEQYMSEVEVALQDIYKTSGRALNRILRQNTKVQEIGTFEFADGTTRRVVASQNQAYKKVMEWRNPDAKEKLEQNNGYTQEVIDAMEAFLKPEVKQWMEWQLGTFYPKTGQEGLKQAAERYGVMPELQTNYSPLVLKTAVRKTGAELTPEGTVAYTTTGTTKSFMKQRTKHKQEVDMVDGDAILMKHITDMAHYTSWEGTVRDLRSVFYDGRVRRAIQENHGGQILGKINDYIDTFAAGRNLKAQTISAIENARARFVQASIGLNPVVFVKQLTSIPAYVADVGVKKFIDGFTDVLNPTKTKEIFDILMESDFMKARYKKGFDRDMMIAMKEMKLKPKDGITLTDVSFALTKLGDKMAIVAGGWSVYKSAKAEAIAKGKSEAEAHKIALNRFSKASKRAQQAGGIADLSMFQQGGTFARLMTMFKTAPNQYFRLWGGSIRSLAYGRGNKKKALRTFALTQFALPMFFQAAANGFNIYDEDADLESTFDYLDPRNLSKEQKRAAGLGVFNGVFLAGDIIDNLSRHVYLGQSFDYGTTPLQSTVKEMKRVIDFAEKLDYENMSAEEISEAIDLTLNVVGKATGVPYQPARRTYEGAKAYIDGKTDDERRLLGWSTFMLGTSEEKEYADKIISEGILTKKEAMESYKQKFEIGGSRDDKKALQDFEKYYDAYLAFGEEVDGEFVFKDREAMFFLDKYTPTERKVAKLRDLQKEMPADEFRSFYQKLDNNKLLSNDLKKSFRNKKGVVEDKSALENMEYVYDDLIFGKGDVTPENFNSKLKKSFETALKNESNPFKKKQIASRYKSLIKKAAILKAVGERPAYFYDALSLEENSQTRLEIFKEARQQLSSEEYKALYFNLAKAKFFKDIEFARGQKNIHLGVD